MIVTHKRFQKIISSEKLLSIETKFNKRGTLVILIGRHLAGLRAQIFLVAGIMSMNPVKFIIVDAISVIFTITIMVGLGYLGGNSLQIVKKDLSRIEHITILLVAITALAYLLWRYFRFRKSR